MWHDSGFDALSSRKSKQGMRLNLCHASFSSSEANIFVVNAAPEPPVFTELLGPSL